MEAWGWSGDTKETTNMQLKFNKYWESDQISYLLFVTAFLDLCYKFDYIEFCFKKMHGVDQTKEMLKKLDDLIRKMFVEYASEHPISIDSSNSSTLASYHASQGNANDVDEDEDWDDQFRLKMNKKCGE